MFKKYPRTDARQVIDYNRFLELTGTKVFICLDRGVMEIARYFLNSRGMWASTYSKEYQDFGYITPTLEEMNVIAEAIAEANIDMSTCDQIITALNGIQSAIEASAPATGSAGCCVGDGGTDVTAINDPPPASEPSREGDPPAGFDTWAEFDTWKCNAIGWFLDNYIGSLRNWAALFGTIGGLTLAVIVGVTLLDLPLVALTLVLGALGSIVGVDIGLLANFSEIADALEDDRANLLCELYGVHNADDAWDIINAATEAAISGLTLPSGVDLFFSVATTQLLSTDPLNVVYTGQGDIEGHTGEDCSGCITADCLAITEGFIDGIEPAEGYDGVLHCRTGGNAGGFGCDPDTTLIRIECPCAVDVHVESTGSYTSAGACDTFYVYDVMDSTLLMSGDTWSDQSIPAGGGFYIFTDVESTWDIFFTNV